MYTGKSQLQKKHPWPRSLARFTQRIIRNIGFRFDALWIARWLGLLGVEFTGNCAFVGKPIVTLAEDSSIRIGDNCLIISRCSETHLGVNHPTILRTLTGSSHITIGSEVGMSGATICAATEITIGEGCLLGANVLIADTDFHGIEPDTRKLAMYAHSSARPINIGRNVFIGTGAYVLKGVTIGDNTVIGACSVVCTDIPPNSIAAGNPAKVLRYF